MVLRNVSGGRAAAERLAPAVQVRNQGIDSFGSVATARGYSTSTRRMPTSFTVTMDNSAGLIGTYVVGDGSGMVAGKTGATYRQPTSAQGISVAALQNSFKDAPVMIQGINYNTTTGAPQFAQNFVFAEADFDKYVANDIFSNEAERNTQYNPNLLTLQFKDQYELDWNSAFLVTVAAGEVVTLTFFLGAAAGR